MKRGRLGGSVLIGLLLVGVSIIVLGRFSEGEVEPVIKVGDTGISRPDVTAPPKIELSANARSQPDSLSDDEIFTGTDDDLVSLYSEADLLRGIGIKLWPHRSLAEYVADLEKRSASGDAGAMLALAELLNACESQVRVVAIFKEDPPDNAQLDALTAATARLCGAVPLEDVDRKARLVAEAARRGDSAAIMEEYSYPPRAVEQRTADRDQIQAWFDGVVSRLSVMADNGDQAAAFRLGRIYSAAWYVPANLPKAATYLRRSIHDQPIVTQKMISAATSSAEKRRLNDMRNRQKLIYKILPVICGRIRPDSVAPGVCK